MTSLVVCGVEARKEGDIEFFQLQTDRPVWLEPITSKTQYSVVPTTVLSAARSYVEGGCKLHPRIGICWKRSDVNQSIIHFAARHCFFNATKEALSALCKDEGLDKVGTVFDLVCTLLDEFLPLLPPAERALILDMRSLEPSDPMPADLPAEVIEEVCGKSDLKDYEADVAQFGSSTKCMTKCCL